jgi:isoaspartyl peptidase/L-asparaginase-like protein (Ntn-hydrolase superfamily)
MPRFSFAGRPQPRSRYVCAVWTKTQHQAAQHVVTEDLAKSDGSGGQIAVDAAGNFILRFNSEGMYRAHVTEGASGFTAIYRHEIQ